MFCHAGEVVRRIAVSLDQRTVADLDRWVKEGSERKRRTRLVRELAKIDPKKEKQLAEQGLGDRAWSEY
jgi:metal-responsive CopG/Arc/MetJ family transcriptional regulator